MAMDLKGIYGFFAIIENGNFDKAAKQLGITTSALSIRVSGLEKVIGGKLLIRKRPFVLTKRGTVVYEHALQLQKLELRLKSKIKKIAY